MDRNGNIYVADTNNNRVRKYDPEGNFLYEWSGFNKPRGVAVDRDGNVYVADTENHQIKKYAADGDLIAKWGKADCTAGTGNGEFNRTRGVAVDKAGNVYVVDEYNRRIQKFTAEGTFITKWGSYGSGNGQFNNPTGVAVDNRDDNVYVADYWNHRIQKFTAQGVYLAKWGSEGTANGQFSRPAGVVVDQDGNIYVAEYANHRVQKFAENGTFLSKWGKADCTPGSGEEEFNGSNGLAMDGAGNIYVTDRTNSRIQKLAYKASDSITGGLEAGRSYDIYVAAEDGNGNLQPEPVKVEVTMEEAGPDTTAPAVAEGTIGTSNLTDTEVTLSWNKATDDVSAQGALQYLVYRSDSNNIDTVGKIEADGTAVGTYEADIDSKTITGLTGSTTYYFNVIVKDEAENKTAYNMQEVTTAAAPIVGTETDIVTFTLVEQTGSATINPVTHTVAIEVVNGTDVTNLTPTITVSAGATIDPASGVSRDFTNPIVYMVTAEDGVTEQEWTVTVTVEEAPVPDSPSIDPATVNFDLAAPADVITFITWGSSATSVTDVVCGSEILTVGTHYTIDANKLAIDEEYLSGLNLTEGDAVDFDISFNDSSVLTLTVNAVRNYIPSGNADLSGLALSAGTLTPGFDPAKTTYSASVGNSVSSIDVTPTTADSKATVTVNGTGVSSGSAKSVSLSTGDNTITIVVTAENGTTKTYTVTVNRAATSSSDDGDSGSNTPVTPTPPPTTIIITTGYINEQTTTTPTGQTVETFTILARASGQITADKTGVTTTVQFNVESSQTSVTNVNIPAAVLESAADLNVSISTPNATLELPAALVNALAAAGKDLALTVTRGGLNTQPADSSVLGIPTIIDTDIVGTTQVTIPLAGIAIPSDPREREAFLAGLAVFTLHSDGEQQLINGEIIYDAGGNPVGITFPVDKFSTFAIVKLSKKTVTLTLDRDSAIINGIPYTLDASPFVDTKVNKTLAPLRFIGEALGTKVEWLPAARQVRITDGAKEIILTLDSRDVLINGVKTQTDCAPVTVPPGRTFLPLRFVGETLGAQVTYDDATRQISIIREYGK